MPHARLMWKTRLFAAIVILTNTLGNFCLARGMRRLAVPVSSAGEMIQAIFDGPERKRLYKEAREYMSLRTKRKQYVADHKANALSQAAAASASTQDRV